MCGRSRGRTDVVESKEGAGERMPEEIVRRFARFRRRKGIGEEKRETDRDREEGRRPGWEEE